MPLGYVRVYSPKRPYKTRQVRFHRAPHRVFCQHRWAFVSSCGVRDLSLECEGNKAQCSCRLLPTAPHCSVRRVAPWSRWRPRSPQPFVWASGRRHCLRRPPQARHHLITPYHYSASWLLPNQTHLQQNKPCRFSVAQSFLFGMPPTEENWIRHNRLPDLVEIAPDLCFRAKRQATLWPSPRRNPPIHSWARAVLVYLVCFGAYFGMTAQTGRHRRRIGRSRPKFSRISNPGWTGVERRRPTLARAGPTPPRVSTTCAGQSGTTNLAQVFSKD